MENNNIKLVLNSLNELYGFENISMQGNMSVPELEYFAQMYHTFEKNENDFPEIRGRHCVIKYTNCIFCYSVFGKSTVLNIYYALNRDLKSALLEMAENDFKSKTMLDYKESNIVLEVYERIMA